MRAAEDPEVRLVCSCEEGESRAWRSTAQKEEEVLVARKIAPTGPLRRRRGVTRQLRFGRRVCRKGDRHLGRRSEEEAGLDNDNE